MTVRATVRTAMASTVFSDRIRTAKELNRRSGAILREAREHAVTVVTEGEAPVVIQPRDVAARAELARQWLLRIEPISTYVNGGSTSLPRAFKWVAELDADHRLAFAGELLPRLADAVRSGDIDAFEQWLYEWEVTSEVDADPTLRRRLLSFKKRGRRRA